MHAPTIITFIHPFIREYYSPAIITRVIHAALYELDNYDIAALVSAMDNEGLDPPNLGVLGKQCARDIVAYSSEPV